MGREADRSYWNGFNSVLEKTFIHEAREEISETFQENWGTGNEISGDSWFGLLHTKKLKIKYLGVLLNFHDHKVRFLV